MKNALYVGALALGGISTQASATPTPIFDPGSGVVHGTIIQDFEGYAPGAAIGPNASVYAASASDAARPAFGSTGNFGAVRSGGSYTLAFAPTNALSFVLGSLDTYNTLTLGFADGTTHSYAGAAISGGTQADGNQVGPATNGVVSFLANGGPAITSATFTASGNSFEFDNIAVGVPEPATWALMIAGFGLVGAVMRRRTMVVAHA